MPATARKHQHVAVIFGKLSYSQGERPKKTAKPGNNSFHRLLRVPPENLHRPQNAEKTPSADPDERTR